MFLIETMGGYCGYLATLSALASGADNAYIFEEKFTVDDLVCDVRVIAAKMEKGVQRYLIVRCERANENYSADFIRRLFEEEAKGMVCKCLLKFTSSQFSTRINELGHAQQGGSPSPFDRNMATKMAARCASMIVEQMVKYADPKHKDKVVANTSETCQLLGLSGRAVEFRPIAALAAETDYKHRLPTDQWWMKLRPLLRILAKHDSQYERDVITINADGDEFP